MLRLSGLINDSIVDGPGLRYAVFVQGCPHHCEGCHNPTTHTFTGGTLVEETKIAKRIEENSLLDGVTYSGGEPFCQAQSLCLLSDLIPERLNVVTYTGYTFEYLINQANKVNYYYELLSRTDILIDGRFDKSKRDISLRFRGSSNQRVLDCKKSLQLGYAVFYNFPNYAKISSKIF